MGLPLLPPRPPVLKLDEGLVAEDGAVSQRGEPGQVVGDEEPAAGDESDVGDEEHERSHGGVDHDGERPVYF